MKILKCLFFVVAALSTTVVSAQKNDLRCDDPAWGTTEFVAELQKVVGNVLVSDVTGMTSGVEKQPLKNKMRITTTSRASVTVVFPCGCDIELKENERVDIAAPNSCAALLAAVQPVPIGVAIGAAAVPSVGGLTGTNALIGATVGVGVYLLYRDNRNVSPN